ncbi:hypothetical protein E8D34_14860 [Nocardioides sp. GY 10113]|uniref:hypothetical protein n=1 Tax=Nocardioides sp. GY 10113 TaxID=2569761 RepID=UPI0010A825CB|nr:hypothetical protein [Nocardioides sp. GY 10113]TIC83842.1 hypothetical protein E8D34_14860 [Nocardioides sp. GY 10113]
MRQNNLGIPGPIRGTRFPSILAWVITSIACLVASVAVVPTSASAAEGTDTATITGRVSSHRQPLDKASVAAYSLGAAESPPDAAELPVAEAATNDEGRFTLVVPVGQYQLRIVDQRRFYASHWVGPDGTRASASIVDASAGSTHTIDVTSLEILKTVRLSYGTWGTLSARRWDETTQTWGPLYRLTDQALFGWVIEPGRYRFLLNGEGLPTWYGDTTDFDEATDVVVNENDDPQLVLTISPVYAQSIVALEPAELLGSGWVGDTLAFRDAAWSVAPGMWSYTVVRDDGKVLARNGPHSYVPTSADAGHTITLHVTAHRDGYNAGASVSDPVLIQNLVATRPPTVAGQPHPGKTLRARVGNWNHPVASYNYQWTRSGKPIARATRATYKPTKADLGEKVAVQVTATTSDGHSGTAAAKAVRVRVGVSFTVSRRTFRSDGHTLTRFKATIHLTGAKRVRTIFKVSGHRVGVWGATEDGTSVTWTTPSKPGRYSYRISQRSSSTVEGAVKTVTAKVR